MLNTTISTGSTMPGGIGPAVSLPALGIQPYAQLPPCVGEGGHRFAIALYHKDRACCERCGLIRKQDS